MSVVVRRLRENLWNGRIYFDEPDMSENGDIIISVGFDGPTEHVVLSRLMCSALTDQIGSLEFQERRLAATYRALNAAGFGVYGGCPGGCEWRSMEQIESDGRVVEARWIPEEDGGGRIEIHDVPEPS
jgi:hypothetical protein